ncbi:hypothetical protein A3K29_02330 [Candidatus Collierbacteria bacterium RIFOXYB2_FULL_46_14]|uniref:Uncharacterized protein n=1 Tax=Candidatus Collierbacteria bacterium GW2011_GWA2_46_26 TaxID=1618381 RepID=A0A0G1PIG6_9BACT|nr:MAG: hypothetical protein UW29_C0010G0028 [Candidatus Collierbacteria bacterium GW2011_GWC2_44_13]KKU32512.1 MAG: hypothetical protein UX47_C0010G0028 [Candidatus Collierbacteria bacterium GW2011_GWA2_46_26]OGD72961.1 MAG: hypothetical protein A3K29_02330 [Candidatus Collierbacteria bacterium RIFOXYB2_FULL_46_14]OGD76003.1 MAG: hypothetical protein A3K43_02330 [Candidatus Collierbacteria bacterium RIFOXYA2_FULL_46_20]OGD77339.1 MAG: hypothetical protein A3K39_02330 [Candidatus Collierbacteri
MEVVYRKAQTNEEIRNWVVLHEGKPAMINDSEIVRDQVGLRIDWPGNKDERMLSSGRATTKDISWEEFFAVMERENLDFEYSDQEDIEATWRYRFVPKYAAVPEE